MRDVALQLLQSFFLNREQYMCHNNIYPILASVNYGVPQGSINGLLLFILFTNDDIINTSEDPFVLSADGMSSFLSDNCVNRLRLTTNTTLMKVRKQLLNNRLLINAQKTELIVVHRQQRRCPSLPTEIGNGNNLIRRVRVTKRLGLYVDENLSWTYHINQVSRILAKFIGDLYKVKKRLTDLSTVQLYRSIIYPNFLYCLSLLGLTNKVYLNKITVKKTRRNSSWCVYC